MGRKTWESLPKKPLTWPQQYCSKPSSTSIGRSYCGLFPEQALDLCPLNEESFVIGGGALYRLFLPYVDKLYITRIYHDFEADTFFPDFDEKNGNS